MAGCRGVPCPAAKATRRPLPAPPAALHAALCCAALRFACHAALQLNMRNLRERERWASGWLQKAEIQAAEALAGAACKACGGSGRAPCPLCSAGGGAVIEL